MSHIVGHSRRKDLQDLRHLPRAPVLSYIQKHAAPRAPRVKTASSSPARFPIVAAFGPRRIWKWIREYLSHRIGPRHPFQVYGCGDPDQGVYKMEGGKEIRIALAGDWATGTDEAASVSKLLISFKAHHQIHL